MIYYEVRYGKSISQNSVTFKEKDSSICFIDFFIAKHDHTVFETNFFNCPVKIKNRRTKLGISNNDQVLKALFITGTIP